MQLIPVLILRIPSVFDKSILIRSLMVNKMIRCFYFDGTCIENFVCRLYV